MKSHFDDHISRLDPAFKRLISMKPCKPLEPPKNLPEAGVYVLFDASGPLYVGRTNRMRKRLGNHCRERASHKMAAFAFRLARETTGRIKPTYRFKGSREDLMRDSTFARAFEDAKTRIRKMDVRFVEETNPIRQCLLEVYVSVVLETRYNDFDNH